MTRILRWTIRAADQLIESAAYLEEAREGAGLELIDFVEKKLETAQLHPHRFPRVPEVEDPEVRRALVFEYGVWIIYEVDPDAIVVLAVWHGARHPEGWQDPDG